MSPPQLDPYDINLSHTVFISGPHHILNNCVNDFPKVLAQWDWFLERLTMICRLLTRKYYKARSLQTCSSSADTNSFAGDIEGFYGHAYAQRWGTTASATTKLASIMPALRYGWNKDAFLHGGQIEQRSAAESCTVVGDIMNALCHNFVRLRLQWSHMFLSFSLW